MNDLSAKISLYQNLFQLCLILATICLMTAAVVFFVLNIKTTFGYLTGRQTKKRIKELREEIAGQKSRDTIPQIKFLWTESETTKSIHLQKNKDEISTSLRTTEVLGEFRLIREIIIIHTEEII